MTNAFADTFLFALLIKSSLIIAIAWIADRALRKRAAASSLLLWRVAVLGLLVLPVLTLALPRWEVRMPAALGAESTPATPTSAVVERPESQRLAGEAANPATKTALSSSPAAASPSIEPEGDGRRITASGLFVAFWLAGCLAFVARWLVGCWSLARLASSSERFEEADWLIDAHELARRLDLEDSVELCLGQPGAMPMTWGLREPRILLPAEARQWSAEERRSVLLHELAHLRQGDIPYRHLASLTQALHWLNPLAWLAMRKLRESSESACDDLVLAGGAAAPDYARQLIDLARSLRPPAPASLAVAEPFALTGRTLLERRVDAILDADRPRRGPSRRLRRIATAAVLPMVALLAACAPAPADGAFGMAPVSASATNTREASKPQPGRSQIVIEARIVESDRAIVNSSFEALADAARGNDADLLMPELTTSGGTLDQRLTKLERDGVLQVLSAPRLVTLSGSHTSTQSGLQLPVQTVNDNAVSTQYVNATLRLEIQATLTPEGEILLRADVQKRYPKVAGNSDAPLINTPIQTTDARTEALVADGGTTTFGGMTEITHSEGGGGPPKKLVVFLTARVLRL